MFITEKEFFYYIFSPDRLTKEKYDYIKQNSAKFKHELEFFESLNQHMSEPISPKLEKKINTFIEKIQHDYNERKKSD